MRARLASGSQQIRIGPHWWIEPARPSRGTGPYASVEATITPHAHPWKAYPALVALLARLPLLAGALLLPATATAAAPSGTAHSNQGTSFSTQSSS
jgi:hypothetical protein